MGVTLIVHVAAGSLALASGYVALFAAKGARVHRGSGMVFVYAMLTMSLLGMAIAVGRGVAPAINVPAGLLTSYLVVTSLATVRPPAAASRWLDPGAMLVALGLGAACLALGVRAAGSAGQGMMVFPLFMFGTVALLAGVGDLRMLRSGAALRGSPRLTRHLWRMSFALFIAALSFFIGQAKVIPEPLRVPPLLATPVLAVLVSMFYWLWRLRTRRSPRGVVPAPSATAA